MASDGRAPLRGWVDFPQYTRHRIPLFLVRDQLALHGLHVVTAADKAVLAAMRGVALSTVRNYATDPEACFRESEWHQPAKAELARRESKDG